MIIKLQACAKINLTLDILGKLDNGYHNVKMILQSIDLADYITVNNNNSKEIHISCSNKEIPTDSRNIAHKAALLFLKKIKENKSGVDIHIEKNIPQEAGLAGGSADAAATLVALNTIFDNKLSIDELCKIAEKAGADVPFCLLGGTMLAEGIGTTLTALPSIPECFIVIVKPQDSISTKYAYSLCDSMDRQDEDHSLCVQEALKTGDLHTLSSNLFNKFEELIPLDSVKSIEEEMRCKHCLNARMTGSGSAVFGIFDDIKYAKKCYDDLRHIYSDVFLCTPTQSAVKIISIE